MPKPQSPRYRDTVRYVPQWWRAHGAAMSNLNFVLDYNTHTRWWIQRMDLYHDMDEEDRDRERKKDEEREKKKPPEMRLCRSSPRTSLTPTSLAT